MGDNGVRDKSMRVIRQPNWKAGCIERCSPSLGGGSGKPTTRKSSKAPRFYPHSTTEAILTLAAEMREGNAQLVAWLQQSSERQERQNQATIVALSEISKGQERLQQGQERIAQGQEQIARGQERIAQVVADSTRALATMLLESQTLTARMLELTRDIHTRITGGEGSGTTH